MDGRFVPNITMGPLVVEAVRRATTLPLDLHLMIQDPERFIPEFVRAGADIVTIHQEACTHVQATLASIRKLGARSGLALCPGTPLAAMEELHEDIDLLLVMTVNPGFGGQTLIPATVGKTQRAHERLRALGAKVELEVDGGVNVRTAPALVRAGAETLVAGSAIFNAHASIAQNFGRLRAAIEQTLASMDKSPDESDDKANARTRTKRA
jgi:ribulose-phosphate 3-epimerase